jgi:hypothetical protein
LPVSAELLELRRIRNRLVELRDPATMQFSHGHPYGVEHSTMKWFEIIHGDYCPAVDRFVDRSTVSWGRCVELAEIAWSQAPKEWVADSSGRHRCTGRLSASRHRTHS